MQRILIVLGLLCLHVAHAAPRPAVAGATKVGVRTPGVRRLYDPKLARLGPGPAVKIKDAEGDKQTYLSEKEYGDLRGAVTTLLTRYAPKDHFFITLGRDAAPISAALHNLGGSELVMNFPAGGEANASIELVQRYLEHLVPDPAKRDAILRGPRSIVLLDVSGSGRSSSSLREDFEGLIAKLGAKTKVKPVVFNSHDGKRINRKEDVEWIDTDAFPDVRNYPWGKYEMVISEYPAHSLGLQSMKQLQKRSEHDAYRDALRERMKRDPELDAFLKVKVGAADAGAAHLTIAPAQSREARFRSLLGKQPLRVGAPLESRSTVVEAEGPDGTPLVLRAPKRGAEQAVRVNTAFARLAAELGSPELVPLAVLHPTAGQIGQVKKGDDVMVMERVGKDFVSVEDAGRDRLRAITEETRVTAALLDVLAEHGDRFDRNILVGPKGEVRLIDPDQSFGQARGKGAASSFTRKDALRYEGKQKKLKHLPAVARALVEKIAQASPESLVRDYGLLEPEAAVLKENAALVVKHGLSGAAKKIAKRHFPTL